MNSKVSNKAKKLQDPALTEQSLPASVVEPLLESTQESAQESTQESLVQDGVKEVSKESDERRFCSSCSRTKPLLGGVMARCANGTKRWKCADCHARSKTHLATIRKSQ